jgi:hypothetical protein
MNAIEFSAPTCPIGRSCALAGAGETFSRFERNSATSKACPLRDNGYGAAK